MCSSFGMTLFSLKISQTQILRVEYNCFTHSPVNAIGPKRTIVRLQQRSKPDRPSNVRPLFTSYNLVTLGWDDGFDGGYNSTKFTVEYRRQGESLPR